MTSAQSARSSLVLVFVLATLTAFAAVNSNGVLGAAFAPAMAALVVYAIVRLPLVYTAGGLFCAMLLFHNPGGRPMGDAWRGPLYPLGEILFNNLRLLLRVDFLRFSTLELLLISITLVALLRYLGPTDLDRAKRDDSAYPLKAALLVSLGALFVMVAWGMAHGGDFRQLLWQVRQLGWIPIMTAVFMMAFRTSNAIRMLGVVVVGVAALRSLEGIYFYFFIQRPRGLELPYLITHEDSVLFCVALTILGAMFIESPTRRSVWLNIALMPPIVFALLMNNRRLAYVSLAGAAIAIWFLLRKPVRRSLKKLGLFFAPLLAVYVAVGWNSTSPVFAPVASLRSVDDENNASNETRDDENFNLIQTIRKSPLIGSGFGHPYDEVRVSYSIAQFMANYRYMAHNSVLAMWALTGLVGFSLIWLPIPIAVFLAVRAYRRTKDPTERVAALASVSAIIAYLSQAYGDMGVTGWMGAGLLAASYAVIGTLAVRVGAWPGRRARELHDVNTVVSEG